MKIKTNRFGEIEVDDESVLAFPNGIIGFPYSTRYVVLDHDREVPFKWLQSVDQAEVAFVVMDPKRFKPDYKMVIAHEDVGELGLTDENDLIVFVILTIPSDDPSQMTANLRGPVVVNAKTRAAKQLVLREDYPTRHAVLQRPIHSSAAACQSLPVASHR
jgi:flagellar assembly factor FliW